MESLIAVKLIHLCTVVYECMCMHVYNYNYPQHGSHNNCIIVVCNSNVKDILVHACKNQMLGCNFSESWAHAHAQFIVLARK